MCRNNNGTNWTQTQDTPQPQSVTFLSPYTLVQQKKKT